MSYLLYTSHILTRNSSIPCLFVLLPGKSEESHCRFFHIIKDLDPTLDPESFMIDSEKASIIVSSKIYRNKTTTMNLHTYYMYATMFCIFIFTKKSF